MEQDSVVNYIPADSPNDRYCYETTLSSGIKLRFNWFYLSRTEIERWIPHQFLLDSNDCKYLEGLSEQNQKDVLLSLANFARRCRKKQREKVFYLRTFPISRVEKNSHFFTKDLREMLPLLLEKESVTLSNLKLKKWESTLNNSFTIDRELLNQIFSDLEISGGSVTIVEDPSFSLNKFWIERRYLVAHITDAYEKFFSRRHAGLKIMKTLICGFKWKDVHSCNNVNCVDYYRQSVESLLHEISCSEFTYIRLGALENKIHYLQQHCAYQKQTLALSHFKKDWNVVLPPEVSHTDYMKFCSDHQLPSYNRNMCSLPAWRARYYWLRGCVETFNRDVKYLKMLQIAYLDNIPEGMADIFMQRSRLATERTPHTKIEFPNGMAVFNDLFYRKNQVLVKIPTKEGECANCQLNENRKKTMESQMLKSQENAKHYEDKMKKANESREGHMLKRTDAENKAKLYEEKALKTMAVEEKLKKRDDEIKQLKKQLNNQTKQSEIIEALKEESGKQKTDLKLLKDANNLLRSENQKHIEEKKSLSETLERLQKDMSKMSIDNKTLGEKNGSLLQKIEYDSQTMERQKKYNDDLDMAHQQDKLILVGDSAKLEKTQVELEETKNQVQDLKIERNALVAQAELDQHDINTYKQKVKTLSLEKELETTQFAREKTEKLIENENLQVVNNALVEKVKRLEDLLKKNEIFDSSVGD